MQRTLHFTRQPTSRASSSASSSSSSQSTSRSSSLTSRRRRGSTASTPLAIEDTPESNEQNDSTSREPPPIGQNYGCIFPIDWDNLYLGKHGKLTGKYGYRIINKRSLSKNSSISTIWKHGADLFWDGPEGRKRLWLCKICHLARRPAALLTINGTDHIVGHLKSKHSLILNHNSHSGTLQGSSEPNAQVSPTPGGSERQPFWAAGYVQAYVDWTILQDITFRQATSTYTRALLTFDRPQIQECLVSSHTSLSDWIKSAFERRRLNIKDLLLTSQSKIHLSCDIWTSTNGMALLGVVAHLVDKGGKLQSILIGLPRIRGSHTAENVATGLATVIQKYQFEHKLGCLMADNATNNDELYEYLSQSLSVAKRERLRCIGHIINLVVKALLYGKGVSKLERLLIGASDQAKFDLMRQKGVVGKVHNIVKYIMRSTARRQDFAENQAEACIEDELFDQAELILIKDGGVRWNSTYFMLRRALLLKKGIDKYLLAWRKPTNDSYDLTQDFLTKEDWAEVEQLVRILKPFVSATKRMEGDANSHGVEGSYGALWESITNMELLRQILIRTQQNLKNADDSFLKSGVNMALQKLDKYFDKMKAESPYYFIAVILHPSLKRAYFRDKWKRWPQWWKHAERCMETVFDDYINEQVGEEDEVVESRRRKVPLSGDDSGDEYSQSLLVDETLTSSRSQKRIKLTTELNRYYEAGLELIKIRDKNGSEVSDVVPDPLNWWLTTGRILYPTLAKIALDLFSIPAMSSACERAFSQAKKIVTDERNRLSADTVEADQCQKWWLLKGLLPSSLIDCVNSNGASTTPWLTNLNTDLTGYRPDIVVETLDQRELAEPAEPTQPPNPNPYH